MLSSPDREFDDLTERLLTATWKFYPDRASKQGLHEYDGGVTDISASSITGRVRETETYLALLHSLDEDNLSENRRFDRRILMSALREEKFRLTELETYRRLPMDALDHVDVSNYILRDYAPRGERVEALTAALAKVPGYLETLQNGLNESIGTPVFEASIEAYEGMRSFYDTDLSTHVGATCRRSGVLGNSTRRARQLPMPWTRLSLISGRCWKCRLPTSPSAQRTSGGCSNTARWSISPWTASNASGSRTFSAI